MSASTAQRAVVHRVFGSLARRSVARAIPRLHAASYSSSSVARSDNSDSKPIAPVPESSTAAAAAAAAPKATPSLDQIIDDYIVATGPMPVARYMQLCLTHPTLGYYSQGDVFGQKGDFITSPEISQIFGELVAIWLLTRWMAAGQPARVRVVELGPGRGTLMNDVLRTFSSLGRLPIEAVHLVEASARMRDVQSATLSQQAAALGAQLHWEDHVDDIPASSDVFTLAIAHEFFDALPIHVLQRTEDGFREVRVTRNPNYLPALNNARFALAMDRESSLLAELLPNASKRFAQLPIGSRLEVSPDSSAAVRSLGRLMAHGGAGLVVDYGGDRSFAQSFRAFRNHKIVDVFDKPGSSDLTANVDFAYLKESLEGTATSFGPIAQSQFLLSMGLEPRLAKLLASANDDDTKERIRKGAQRLVDKTGMGSQYQVMGFGVGPAAEGEVYPFPASQLAPAPASVIKP